MSGRGSGPRAIRAKPLRCSRAARSRCAPSAPMACCKPRGETAVCGIMGIDIGNARIGEQVADRAIGIARCCEPRGLQHSVGIEGAQRERAALEHRRGFVAIACGPDTGPDIDGIGAAIGRRDIVAGVMEQNQLLARLRILKADAARETAVGGRFHTPRVDCGEARVVERKQGRKAIRAKPLDQIGHRKHPFSAVGA